MPKYTVRDTGEVVNLDNNTFKAKGGEGSIHIFGSTVYKICDAGKMIPDGKFKELSVLDHPRIVRPKNIILDTKGQEVGYTMDLVPGNALPLARILTKQYRERESVTPQMMAELVKQIADGLRFIHSKPGYLQVDGNELNYMVTNGHKDIFFIDVNSFETPNYPATAIMSSIRDWRCPKDASGRYAWNHNTDWFSFAVVSFFMFCGIHPFKGNHPKYPNVKTFMVDQMRDGISVLRPDVTFPQAAVYMPFEDYIPGGKDGAFMQWYRAVFLENKRLPAPADYQAAAVLGTLVQKITQIVGSNNFDINEIRALAADIIGYYQFGQKEAVVTKKDIWLTGNRSVAAPAERFRVGFTPVMTTPVALYLEGDNGDNVRIKNLDNGADIPIQCHAKDIMSYRGRLYVLGSKVFEIMFMEKNGLMALPQPVADALPSAQMFQGCVIQNMFGNYFVSVFPDSKRHYQVPVKELTGYQIVDAKYEGNVLVIVGVNQEGEYDRFVFLLDGSNYDVRKVENVNFTGINFTVTDKGICVMMTEDEKVEIFEGKMGSTHGVKSIDDPAIDGDMRLCHSASHVQFAKGNKLFSIAVKKKP